MLINPGHIVECPPPQIPVSEDKEQSSLRHHRTKLFFRDQALNLWSRSTDSKTLDYQNTNPRGYQIVRTHTKETTGIQDLASHNHQLHLIQDTYLSNKQNKNTNPIIMTVLPPHSAFPIRGKTNKQAKTQHKSPPIGSLHKPLDQTQEGRNQKEERITP